jgi:hypothetical protein
MMHQCIGRPSVASLAMFALFITKLSKRATLMLMMVVAGLLRFSRYV